MFTRKRTKRRKQKTGKVQTPRLEVLQQINLNASARLRGLPRQRAIRSLKREAEKLGFELVPNPT
jgi:hypothetical protein